MPDTFESTYERLCAADGAFGHPIIKPWRKGGRLVLAHAADGDAVCEPSIAHAAIAHHVLVTLEACLRAFHRIVIWDGEIVAGEFDGPEWDCSGSVFPHTPLGILQLALAVVSP